jgi:hypothetical protein
MHSPKPEFVQPKYQPKQKTLPVPKPAPQQQYTEAFPSLSALKAPTNVRKEHTVTQKPPAQARFKRNNQKRRDPPDAIGKHDGHIGGDQAMQHLKEFNERKKVLSDVNNGTAAATETK